MTAFLARPVIAESVVSRWDPRWKLAALVLAVAAVVALRALLPCLVAFAAAVALAALARLPARVFLTHLGGAAAFLALFAVLLPFLPAPGPAWEVGPVRVSAHGLTAAARLCLKALTVLALMLVLWVTTPPTDLFKAAHALRVPGVVLHLLVLTYRYLFLLVEELGRLRLALRVRGYRNRPNFHSYRTVGHVAGTLVVRGAERAERVGQALRCRGFDGRFRSLTEFRTRAGDVLAFTLAVAVAAGLVVWDVLQR
jgi:cobalt/nickel transport system permease protein